MDIRAKQAGVFVKGFASEGAEVSVGAGLYELDPEGKADTEAASPSSTEIKQSGQGEEAAAEASTADKSGSPVTGEPIEVKVPVMGESITTGVLAKWLRREGEAVVADEVVASIETDKVTVEVRSPQAGTVSKVFSSEAAEVNVGDPLFTLIPGEVASSEKPSESAPSSPPEEPPKSVYKETTESKKAASEAKVQTAPAEPASSGNRSETRVKMTRMRMRISQRLKEAQNTAAMLTTFQEVDMSKLIDLRNTHKEHFEKVHGVKLGFMSAFVKVLKLKLIFLDLTEYLGLHCGSAGNTRGECNY